MNKFASIILDVNVDKALDYFIPKEMEEEISLGSRVEVPLKGFLKKGYVIEIREFSNVKEVFPIKRIISKEFLSTELLSLAISMAKYYSASLSKTLKCMIPPSIRKERVKINPADILLTETFLPTKPKNLNEEQNSCLEKILSSIKKEAFEIHLIFGITGSGKTEIYLQAIQKALDLNKSAIMLVPEIALTPQTIERFKTRFKDKIALLHHKRSTKERFDDWQSLKKGEAKIVIGARSAIFSPMKDLGLIILDEEHDSSYKQTEEPTYHAKTIALMRGKIENCTVVLGSATPSLESYFQAKEEKYILSSLLKRANESDLAKVYIVDMKKEKMKDNFYFSEPLLGKIKDRFEKGEQTLLFLNRRGYKSFLICKNCSYLFKCPHCDISLTFHKAQNLLICHSCDYRVAPPNRCPSCKLTEHIEYKGFGTQLIEKSLKCLFPEIRILRIDRDTTECKNSHDLLFKEFKAGKADVLIGTQMIVKGLHFPNVTLVGVLNTDAALNIPDFRSSETVFQLLTQVAGRAGRSEIKGEVIVQTFLPDNDTIKQAAKQDFTSFYSIEIENRRLFNYPPFSHIVKIVFSGKEENKVLQQAASFRKELISSLPSNYFIHPICPSGHAKIKDKFRFQFLIRGKSVLPIRDALQRVKTKFKLKSTKILIDVDPLFTYY